MKKIWIYLLGVLSGVVLTILGVCIINKAESTDITFFEEPGEIVTAQSLWGGTEIVKGFEVFQVLDKGVALAKGNDLYTWDLIVLLWNDNGEQYYDNQSVIAPIGKCFRQIGIYKYKSKDEIYRTVPVITLMDCETINNENVLDERQTSFNGMSFFDEPGEVMSDKSYQVSRVLDNGAAIARGKNQYGYYYGLEVLLWDEDANYYDDQVVKAPNGKCFRQIGIYKSGISTYPIVTLKDSNSSEQNTNVPKTTQKNTKPKNSYIEETTTAKPNIESNITESNNTKLDKNKAYRLIKD